MRLTTVIIIASLMQVSAATFGQRITINQRHVPLKQILREIRAQSGYDIISDTKTVLKEQKATLVVKDAELKEALTTALEGLNLTYEIKNKIITIKRKETPSFLDDFIANSPAIDVRGKVLDEKGQPLVGATVAVKGKNRFVMTDQDGAFFLDNVGENDKLVVSFIGYQVMEVDAANELESLTMVVANTDLEEVKISTGYQTIDKSKVTGSVTVVDNKLLNRAVSSDLLSRLNGVTNGLLVDKIGTTGNPLGISVRGRSTIFSNTKPLIVVDNFPFEGDINTINPNDVENLTLLKDAAAAAIWGVRAGNGVIVITTKKGMYNQKSQINLISNLTIGEKPDLYYQPQLTSSEFIDIETFLFENGKYDVDLLNNFSLISPVIELLSKRTAANAPETDAKINGLRQIDSRDQIEKYFYRNSLAQQYHLSISGGGTNNLYNISAGFDKNLSSNVGNANSRYSVKVNNTHDFLNRRLKLTTDINLTRSIAKSDNALGYTNSVFPYEQIADNNGNPLSVLNSGGLRSSYTDTAGNGRLLDWKYRPLEERIEKSNTSVTESIDSRINTELAYKIFHALTASVNYQFYKTVGSSENLQDMSSFRTRNDINSYTQLDPATGMISYPMPMGAGFSKNNSSLTSNYGRGQLTFQDDYNDKHSLNVIAGYEIRSDKTLINSLRLVGYDPETGGSITPNNQTFFFNYWGAGGTQFNSNNGNIGRTTNNFLSYYATASYSYLGKYVASGSYRKDESNLFGVATNQKGVPLWSLGFAWNVDKEKFFGSLPLERFQLRGSFGYNGNVNNSLSSVVTARPETLYSNPWGSPFSVLVNPPNPSLRWEKVKNLNVGFDFALKRQIISGSIEVYRKDGSDLIGSSPLAKQTGLNIFTGNVANTSAHGIDIQLNSVNFNSQFKWYTSAILNISKDRITRYMKFVGTNSILANGSFNPLVDYPINSIFSFKYAGLDNLGEPQGFQGDEISRDYTAILNSTNSQDLKFHGSATPTVFGALRNTFEYGNFAVSINISYKLGYHLRRELFSAGSIISGNMYRGNSDYKLRWQKPGDELTTTVPALIYPVDDPRDALYTLSEAGVVSGNHVRLRDIQASLALPESVLKKININSLTINAYANNLWILWRDNKLGIDPDALIFPEPKYLSLGIKATF